MLIPFRNGNAIGLGGGKPEKPVRHGPQRPGTRACKHVRSIKASLKKRIFHRMQEKIVLRARRPMGAPGPDPDPTRTQSKPRIGSGRCVVATHPEPYALIPLFFFFV